MDSASDSGSEGWGFESLLACHAKSPFCPKDKAGFLRMKCADGHMKCALRMKLLRNEGHSMGIITGTLRFMLCLGHSTSFGRKPKLHDGGTIASF